MPTLQPGTLLQNRYLIEQLIGQGGFGVVYAALDQPLNRQVAVKQLVRAGERISRQFEREAKLLANLRHAALPRVTDYFAVGSDQFLVMEFVPGDDIATLLEAQNAPFPVPQVLAWADQLLDALQYLHTHTPPIIHRDIKPQNLKLRADGSVMLLDFGLAKGFAGGMVDSTTERSILAYTRGYAPPEQVEGTGTDARSDLYALGGTLRYLLTNVPPLEAQSRQITVMRGRADPLETAHELNPDVPLAVSKVIQQALALTQNERPPSALAMRNAFGEAQGKAPVSVPEQDATVLDVQDATVLDVQDATVVDAQSAVSAQVPVPRRSAMPTAKLPPRAKPPTAPVVKPPVVRLSAAAVTPTPASVPPPPVKQLPPAAVLTFPQVVPKRRMRWKLLALLVVLGGVGAGTLAFRYSGFSLGTLFAQARTTVAQRVTVSSTATAGSTGKPSATARRTTVVTAVAPQSGGQGRSTPTGATQAASDELRREVDAALKYYNDRRAEALRTSNEALLKDVATGTLLAREVASVRDNRALGAHPEISISAWRIDRIEVVGSQEVLVNITKTEDRLWFPKNCTVPDDIAPCLGNAPDRKTRRNETYAVRYHIIKRGSVWKIDQSSVLR